MGENLIMLIAGTILGFGTSIGTIKYQEFQQRKRALNIFKIELYKINKSLPNLIRTDLTMQQPNGEIIPFTGISTTEIPNFKMVMQMDVFLSLDENLRQSIYDISLALEAAENNRKQALPLLNLENRVGELKMYCLAYIDYLNFAKEKVDTLKHSISENN